MQGRYLARDPQVSCAARHPPVGLGPAAWRDGASLAWATSGVRWIKTAGIATPCRRTHAGSSAPLLGCVGILSTDPGAQCASARIDFYIATPTQRRQRFLCKKKSVIAFLPEWFDAAVCAGVFASAMTSARARNASVQSCSYAAIDRRLIRHKADAVRHASIYLIRRETRFACHARSVLAQPCSMRCRCIGLTPLETQPP